MTPHTSELHLQIDGVVLDGLLEMPAGGSGIVVFAHGSGSSRFSPRNRLVARALNKRGMGTFLLDLLTSAESDIYETRFDIDLLTARLSAAVRGLQKEPQYSREPLGLFGASTGAAAALRSAADLGGIGAVVSRGGRPDLAAEALERVTSPTLLVVGARDYDVLQLNRAAFKKLRCEKKLEIVPEATHLFEEPGTLEEVARLAGVWFKRYLLPRR
jgi:putative phosphoribosyl transferase